MRVTVERAALLKALGHVHRVVERRNTIPILSNVLLRGEDGSPASQGDRSRHRGDGDHSGRYHRGRLDDGAGLHDLRHRPQTAGRRPGLARDDRRYRPDADPLGPLALHAAGAAGKRFPGSRRRRAAAPLHPAGDRSQAPYREDAIRDLHRGDALLPQRHLPSHHRCGRHHHAPRGRDRRSSPRPRGVARADRLGRHARRHRAAQGGRRDRQARGRRQRNRRRSNCPPPRSA